MTGESPSTPPGRRGTGNRQSEAPKHPMEFEDWKLRLRSDCEAQGKLLAFDSFGEYALRLLWEEGIEPSVKGIVGTNKQNEHRSKRVSDG